MGGRKPKEWRCANRECGEVLGLVLFGQLYCDSTVSFNTDGADIVIRCPKCDRRKIWYASDRLTALINEIADAVVRRVGN